MSTDTVAVDPMARNIVNQLFDLLAEEISRRSDEPLQKYLLVDARQASNDRAVQFVTKLLAAIRHEHGERIAKAQEALRVYNPNDSSHTASSARGYETARWDCARIARDLSPPP